LIVMPDDTEKLRHAVHELHEALQSARDLDPQTRQLLEQTLADVRAVLATPSEPPSESAPAPRQLPLRRQLSEAAAEFEGSHPGLAGSVRSVIDALAQMGI
jgi:hypothetical protein